MNLKHCIVCSGSRNAPLVMAFSRFKSIKCYSQVDERSAAFKGLGMSMMLKQPVAVICTSGTAVLNFYPAIAEAYYRQIPLIAITADRPSDMIDKWDGQTIKQNKVFQGHVVASYSVNENISIEEIEVLINKIHLDLDNDLKGPIHINIHLKEPLYAHAENDFVYPELNLVERFKDQKEHVFQVVDDTNFEYLKNILIVNGEDSANTKLNGLCAIVNNKKAVVLNDVVSNKTEYNSFKQWESIFLNQNIPFEAIKPDLLITTGKMILNKTLKSFLKKEKNYTHWHICVTAYYPDPFDSNPVIIKSNLADFFEYLNSKLVSSNSDYFNEFEQLSNLTINKINEANTHQFTEWNILEKLLPELKDNSVLHLSNSMSVRYVSYLSYLIPNETEVYGNRATSGIDGCSSTAIGAAIVSDKNHYLITGDVAFFYDINAWWQNPLPNNLKIILLNNQIGEIFHLINGPEKMKEIEFLTTPHQFHAEHICKHFNIGYHLVQNWDEFNKQFKAFNSDNTIRLIEIKTNSQDNINHFKSIKS